ncbi:FAD-dependent oxidoreductase [Pantoea phytobeneficialis]|uniref:Dehydrogenase n=1 Tax=Pantoea phytobeneficialis TaxID=2052056 RepID=A0AAP9H4Z7_9GAMM|nr:FAD-dependent oxidoreductase [Pantoea phytobeneficialis]MDO6408049.1 FAD-dependent oxidoreductase [Pantoea phytobeneficialis]QGR06421.1 dehydrogenase [Pantoea phytobeneficialis]
MSGGRQCDVLVIGSGGAALSAALRAAVGGLSVLVLEKSAWLGGTTAMSGGATWVPANHHALAAGLADSSQEALDYLRASAPEGWQASEDTLWQALAQQAPLMLAFVEQHSALRFALTPEGDPLWPLPGAKQQGRMLAPMPLQPQRPWRLRPTPLPRLFSYHELLTSDLWHQPIRTYLRALPRLLRRQWRGELTKGAALVAGLLDGCQAAGCEFITEAAVQGLLMRGSHQVTGVRYRHQGEEREIEARCGVVIASGGFEWDAQQRQQHFPGPYDFIASPRDNSGDGQRMAESAGAQLAHMDQANIGGGIPAAPGQPWSGLSVFFHYEPNAILVDRHGQRFTNEFVFNLGAALDARDAQGLPRHLPVWLISDARLLRRAPLLRYYRWRTPGWLRQAATLTQLAQQLALPAGALEASVARFNHSCARGIDEDFSRHLSAAHGKADRRLQGGLAAICHAPFIAIPFNRTFLATKGGPRTDASGNVLHRDGRPLAGLYCAGAAMANPIGSKAVSAGTTLGPNLTWGYICGSSLLARRQALTEEARLCTA